MIPQYQRVAAQQAVNAQQNQMDTARKYFWGWPFVAAGIKVDALKSSPLGSIGMALVSVILLSYGLGNAVGAIGGVRNPLGGFEGMFEQILVAFGFTLLFLLIEAWLTHTFLPRDYKDDPTQIVLLLLFVVPVITFRWEGILIGIAIWFAAIPVGRALAGNWEIAFRIVVPGAVFGAVLWLVLLLTASVMILLAGGDLKPGENAADINRRENEQRRQYVLPTPPTIKFVPGTGDREIDDFPQKFPELGPNARTIVLNYCGSGVLDPGSIVVAAPIPKAQMDVLLAQMKERLDKFCATYNGDSSRIGPGGAAPPSSGPTPRPTFTPRPNEVPSSASPVQTPRAAATPTKAPTPCPAGWVPSSRGGCFDNR
jgi:hypothetical protein